MGAVALAALASLLSFGFAAKRSLGASGGGEPTPQTDNSVPAPNVTLVGSSPQEASNETWGVGRGNGAAIFHSTLVRYTSQDGWTLGPQLEDSTGAALTAFRLASPTGGAPSPLAGQMTPAGNGALLGEEPAPASEGAGKPRQTLLVRDPGGAFREVAALPQVGESALGAGESLFAGARAPLLAVLDEGAGRTGALVVPVTTSGAESRVLHWSGSAWTSEKIAIPAASSGDFRVLAIGAGSPTNAWLLAQLSASGGYPSGAVALFRRLPGEGSEAPTWVPVSLTSGTSDGEAHPLTANERPFVIPNEGQPPSVRTQVLTVTSEGVWVDGERADVHASTTLFFKPEGQAGGKVAASWCMVPSAAPACDHELPEALPSGPSRSFAWANPSAGAYGERVITGFAEGKSLRLEGTTFKVVLGLGGGPESAPGSIYGAAFSGASEGWLGDQELPVHLTLNPSPSRLTAWPVSFRHALLAVAPQPGVPVGALSSEALAVGDQGEVARYMPGVGWQPESLLSAGGRREAPRLRAVAWPTANRAYAVGDGSTGTASTPQMWLWRGETGLWEPDPATPYNFRGNLMGIAFDPTNPSRGYAVGESGVLLSYGKTWSQEQSLPPEVAGASFTSIAFAGSEAIVAYRKLVDPSRASSYVGGLLVNSGSGWHVDQSAAAALGSEVPLVVGGLADGGAAVAAQSFSTGEGARIYTRSGAGAGWQPVATPFPGGAAPGSLALFRESGALRVIASGTAPAGYDVESVTPSPPGFPPPLIEPYGVGSNLKSGILRETASGWSDEQHELNNATEPRGQYSRYDTVYQPDPLAAVLIDPSGGQGWAVGGFVDNANRGGPLDTADIERYPADGVAPYGVGSSVIPTSPAQATFAIGGGAQCAAPCADRARARIGPDVWLQNALARASQIGGVRSFLYTGPRVTSGETVGPAQLVLPVASELNRYAELLAEAPPSLPTFAAASAAELDGQRGEGATFESVFGAFPQQPFGGRGETSPVAAAAPKCADKPGCQSAYYAFDSAAPAGGAGTVRVIVLDDGAGIGPEQLQWLKEQLTGAKGASEPAIVVGNADLEARISAGDTEAAALVSVLLNGEASASAYFFDAPERNVREELHAGAASLPAFGSGTLGYVNFTAEGNGHFTGASGFMLAKVDTSAANRSAANVAPVSVSLIPNIGELALEAQSGTLVHRSATASFVGLARRARSGNESTPGEQRPQTDPYIPIPSICRGVQCATALLPEYRFSSSKPGVGDFVKPNLAISETAVLLGANGQPIADPSSGLFCAYNAGTTIVTISAGGLSASLPVTVQAGSVRRPCGTQPAEELPPVSEAAAAAPPAPAPTPAPTGAAPAGGAPPPIPVPPAPAIVAPPAPPVHVPVVHPVLPVLVPQVPPTPLLAILPPPLPTPARPTPPSGTSAVSSPVEAPEKEEEEEGATESVSNQAVAYRASEHETPPLFLLSFILLAALAGASTRRRPRRSRRDVRVAPATTNAARWQQRASRRGPR